MGIFASSRTDATNKGRRRARETDCDDVQWLWHAKCMPLKTTYVPMAFSKFASFFASKLAVERRLCADRAHAKWKRSAEIVSERAREGDYHCCEHDDAMRW